MWFHHISIPDKLPRLKSFRTTAALASRKVSHRYRSLQLSIGIAYDAIVHLGVVHILWILISIWFIKWNNPRNSRINFIHWNRSLELLITVGLCRAHAAAIAFWTELRLVSITISLKNVLSTGRTWILKYSTFINLRCFGSGTIVFSITFYLGAKMMWSNVLTVLVHDEIFALTGEILCGNMTFSLDLEMSKLLGSCLFRLVNFIKFQ
jgi:hypothetical protein